MHPFPHRRCRWLILLAATTALTAQEPALKGLDPIALCRGEQVAGQPDLSEQHGNYTYHFATAANLATFRASPERYEIQLGGGCARMGPLSGPGDADRFHVHGERIYIFASDACREGFTKDPERFLEPAPPRPAATAEQRADGERLRDRAIEAHGGLERLRSWRTYRQQHDVVQGDTKEQFRLFLEWSDQPFARQRSEHDYTQGDRTWRYAQARDGDTGFFVEQGKLRPMSAPARRELQQAALREPLPALRASLQAEHLVVARGKNRVLDVAVDEFELWQHGTSTIFGVDEAGRVRTARFRGRGSPLWFGDLALLFDDYTTIGGLLVPQHVRGTFDGKFAEKLSQVRHQIEVDVDLPANAFVPPK